MAWMPEDEAKRQDAYWSWLAARDNKERLRALETLEQLNQQLRDAINNGETKEDSIGWWD